MRVEQHLISMPLSNPAIPSIQLGCLKSFTDEAFKGHVKTHVHSAFFAIPLLMKTIFLVSGLTCSYALIDLEKGIGWEGVKSNS
jgi:hypothetical protein